jgi:cyanophycin synthetase
MKLDLENLAGKESCEIPGFNERLQAVLRGVAEHYCGLGHPGGLLERLRTGTYFGHVVEHVALELTSAVNISVNRGKTVAASDLAAILWQLRIKQSGYEVPARRGSGFSSGAGK